MRGEVRPIGGTNTALVAIFGNNIGYPMAAIIKVPSGAGTIYLGQTGVTTAGGFPLAAGESLEVDMVNEALYAVATVTTTVYILRRGDA